MSRLDRKSGRFDPTYESVEIESALAGHQTVYGQVIAYFRFAKLLTETHDIYDEAAGAGRVFYDPVDVPVLQVIREEGSGEQEDGGLYWTDTIHITASFKQLINVGLELLDIQHGRYLRDRLVYDGRVFRIEAIHVLGQLKARDVMVGIDAVQMKREDLLDDPQFIAWWGSEYAERAEPRGPYIPGPGNGGAGPHIHTAHDVGAYTQAETDAAVAAAVAEAEQYTDDTAAPLVHSHPSYVTFGEVDGAVASALQPVTVNFAVATTVWDYTHNLGYSPRVTTTDLSGRLIDGDVSYPSPTSSVRVTWAVPVSGVLQLN